MKKCVVAVSIVVLIIAGAPHGAGAQSSSDPLTIRVPTRMASEPAEVLVRARVEPDERSRELTIEWWTAEGFGGSHLISLEGDRAATWHHYSIKRMEAGEYEVAAVLKRNDGTRVKRTATVIVIGERGIESSSSSSAASR